MGSRSDGNYAALRAAARISGGEILRDARGMPDFFAVLNASDLTVNGQKLDRLLMGKYEACARLGGLYALPLESPRTGLTFEAAAALVLEKGLGYHLLTLAEWALLCKSAEDEGGGYVNADAPISTGSGAWAYAHNGRWTGVWDAAGNVREWICGYRTVDGEIQIIPNNNAAGCEKDELGAGSTLWRAIDKSGNLVAPGTADTLKWQGKAGQITLNTTTVKEDVSYTASLESVSVDESVQQTALNLLEVYGIKPGMRGVLSINTSGERIAAVGACYKDKSPCVRVLCGTYTRGDAPEEVGVRICYVEGLT